MRLWIGGSSGLTRTYLNTFPTEQWILLGCEVNAPSWLNPLQRYIRCDLTEQNLDSHEGTLSNALTTLQQVLEKIDACLVELSGTTCIHQIVVGIRPVLVSHQSHLKAQWYNDNMLKGLHIVLDAMVTKYQVNLIIHISSIAAVEHIPRQHLRSVHENDPSSDSLLFPYDRFKRGCEERIERLVQNQATSMTKKNIQFTNLRLGAIFSDDPWCIQCTALALQCYTGPYLTTPIDCNSSHNVSQLLHRILSRCFRETIPSDPCTQQQQQQQQQLRPVYYYTRCISQYPKPVPYGEFFMAYRKAYGLSWLPVVLPTFLVKYGVVLPFHFWTVLLQTILPEVLTIPYVESIDYLLQVTINEHTFDMKETIQDFPELIHVEETMDECFCRRRKMLQRHCGVSYISSEAKKNS
jgi:hypothetical protein